MVSLSTIVPSVTYKSYFSSLQPPPSVTTNSDTTSQSSHFKEYPIETYEDVIQHTAPKILRDLEKKMDCLIDGHLNLDLLVDAINRNDLNSFLFTNPKFDLLNLRALREKKINGMTYTTAQLFSNAISHLKNPKNFEQVPLLKDTGINPEAQILIEETNQFFQGTQYTDELSFHNSSKKIKGEWMSEEQLARFYSAIKELPSPFEQQIILIEEPRPITLRQRREKTLSILIAERSRFNLFSRLAANEDFSPRRIIVSKGIILAYLHAIKGPNLITRLQLSPHSSLKAGMIKNERAFYLPTSLFPESYVDGFRASRGTNTAAMHDVYHGMVFSYIPEADRKKFHCCGEIFETLNNKEVGTRIANVIYDMDRPSYKLHQHGLLGELDPKALFWFAMAQALYSAESQYRRENDPYYYEAIGESFWTSVEEFIHKIKENQDKCKESGLDIDYLQRTRISSIQKEASESQIYYSLISLLTIAQDGRNT